MRNAVGLSREAGAAVIIAADRIITSPHQPVIQHGAVVVRNGKIEAVGSASDFDEPDVDLGDKTLTAGFIDAHVHLAKAAEGPSVLPHHQTSTMQMMQAISNAQRFLRVGVTSVRDLGSPNGIVGMVRDAIDNGTIKGARIRTSNEVITITGGHGYAFGMEVDDLDAMKQAVRRHVKQGSDWIKVMASGGFTNPYRSEKETPFTPLFSLDEMRVIVAESHRFGIPVTAHCQGRESIENAFFGGVDTIEHASFAAHPVAFVDQDLARAIGLKKVPVVPTTNNYWLGQGVPWAPLDIALTNLKILYDCGVVLAAGTDMGLPSTTPETYADGLTAMALAGIPLADVLAAATTNGAQAIGRPLDEGHVAVGFVADLVAMDGNPLEDIGAYSRVTWTMAGGNAFAVEAETHQSRPFLGHKAWSGVHLFGD
jgi:imidazolonepropionase-like amidohydrolase